MASAKRRGKTFCTENYLDDETRQMVYDVITSIVPLMVHDDEARHIGYKTELYIWFCPRGVYLDKDNKPTINWSDLDLSDEFVGDLLGRMVKAFKKYGKQCPDTHHFRILLTDGDFADMMNMLNL